LEEGRAKRNNGRSQTASHPSQQGKKVSAILSARARSPQFEDDKLSCDDRRREFRQGKGLLVRRLAFVQKSKEEIRVRKNGVHGFFGAPER